MLIGIIKRLTLTLVVFEFEKYRELSEAAKSLTLTLVVFEWVGSKKLARRLLPFNLNIGCI